MSRCWYWQLCGEYWALAASGPGNPALNWLGYVKITAREEETRAACSFSSIQCLSWDSWKTKLNIPMSAVKKRKDGRLSKVRYSGWERGLKTGLLQVMFNQNQHTYQEKKNREGLFHFRDEHDICLCKGSKDRELNLLYITFLQHNTEGRIRAACCMCRADSHFVVSY